MDLNALAEDIEDEESDEPSSLLTNSEDEHAQEEGDEDEETSVLAELTMQVSLLGTSYSPFAQLNDKIMRQIFADLSLPDLLSASLVCSQWEGIIRSCDALWRPIYHSIPEKITTYLPVTNVFERVLHHGKRLELRKDPRFEPELVLQRCIEGHKIPVSQVESLLRARSFVNTLHSGDTFLLDLLQQNDVITELLDSMLRPISGDWNTPFNQENLRVAHLSFQTLGSDLMLDVLITNPPLLDVLFYFLETVNRRSTPAPNSVYFSKLVSALFEHYPTETVEYCKQHLRVIRNLVENINNPYLLDVLYKLVDSDLTHRWLVEARLIPSLADGLNSSEPLLRQEQIADCLASICSLCQPWGFTPLVNVMLNDRKVLNRILEYAEEEPLSSFRIQQSVKVLGAAIQLVRDDLVDAPLIVTLLRLHVDFYASVLQPGRLATNEQFGLARLGVVELVGSLIGTGFPVVVETLKSSHVFCILVDLLFQHKWNNILHCHIAQIFSDLLYCNHREINNVLKKCNLVDLIIDAHEDPSAHSGYIGHLRQIGNEIFVVAEHSPSLSSFLAENSRWELFVAELDRINEIEGIHTFPNEDYEMDMLDESIDFETTDIYEDYEIDDEY